MNRHYYNLTPTIIVGSECTPTLVDALNCLRDDGVDPDWLLVLEARALSWEDQSITA